MFEYVHLFNLQSVTAAEEEEEEEEGEEQDEEEESGNPQAIANLYFTTEFVTSFHAT